MKTILLALLITSALAGAIGASVDNRFAAEVVEYAGLPAGLYGNPEAVLGKPTTWIQDPGTVGGTAGVYACSMVCAAYNLAPDGSNVVTTLGNSVDPGYVVMEFDQPICDDPDNWYGKDFIVFGNAIFAGAGYLTPSTDMEIYRIISISIFNEPVTVSVSPDLVDWYTYSSPTADGYWPTHAFAWDRDAKDWGAEQDWTKPVDPALVPSSLLGKYVADAIDFYQGSAGGTAFDLAESGFEWIKYVKVTGHGGEVDAVARVTPPLSIAQAKVREDGVTVSLADQLVTAGSSELGDCFYIESLDRACAIKVTGGTAEQGDSVTFTGVLRTVDGEREIAATWMKAQPGGNAPLPLGMPPSSLGSAHAAGLLVRTWGRVSSVDESARTFDLDDGSGTVTCNAASGMTLPDAGTFLSLTGINSRGTNESSDQIITLRLRDSDDLRVYAP